MFDPNLPELSLAALHRLRDRLASFAPDVDDAVRIERIRALEELKAAAAAAQAAETAAFAKSQRAQQEAKGVPAHRAGRGIALQVALARRISHHQAQRYVGWSVVLTAELEHTFAELQRGRVPEWRAMLVARETLWLSREHRVEIDAELAPQLEALGDKRVEAETKKMAYRLDPRGYVARVRGAVNDRRVSVRPAPDTMSRLMGFLPVAQGVAAYAALCREADAKIAEGDARGRGQIMADTLVERITGQAHAGDVPVEINLVMTDQALLGVESPASTGCCASEDAGVNEPAHLDGHGPIPAELARELVLEAADSTPMWLRRLFREPGSGELVAMESDRRFFSAAQRRFLRLRDQVCRTPWCEAPIRHSDHITPAEQRGPTAVVNGDGQCAACNYAKEAPGWAATPESADNGAHRFTVTTPTGHQYRSRAPAPPGGRTTADPPVRSTNACLATA
jgi:hypothetical protein